MNTVSIIIPVFNSPLRFLSDCIKSINNQSYPKENIEIILCDDGSPKLYQEKLKLLVEKETSKVIRSKLILKKQNTGLSDARNFAINKSEGEWLFILDSDDFIQKYALENLINCVHNGSVIAYGDHVKVTECGEKILYHRKKENYQKLITDYFNLPIFNPLYSTVFISHGEIIKKSALLDVNLYEGTIGEKPPVLIKLYEKFGPNSFVHTSKVVYFYRENKHGIATIRKNELIDKHKKTFLEAMNNHSHEISDISYIGRVYPFQVKHMLFKNDSGEMIVPPYLNLKRMELRENNLTTSALTNASTRTLVSSRL